MVDQPSTPKAAPVLPTLQASPQLASTRLPFVPPKLTFVIPKLTKQGSVIGLTAQIAGSSELCDPLDEFEPCDP